MIFLSEDFYKFIAVREDTRKKLRILKANMNVKSFDLVLNYLIDDYNARNHSKITEVSYHEATC